MLFSAIFPPDFFLLSTHIFCNVLPFQLATITRSAHTACKTGFVEVPNFKTIPVPKLSKRTNTEN